MSYNDDKRELLKLKQGLIEESDVIPVDKNGYGDKGKYEVKGAKNKLINFFYLYKIPIISIAFAVFLLAFIIFSAASVEKEDLRVLMIASDPDICESFLYKSKDYELALEMYTPNYDNNKYVHVNNYNVDLSEQQDANYFLANNTKLFSEIRLGVAQIFIGDMEQLTELLIVDDNGERADAYEDLSLLYPDDPHVVDKYYYQLKGTAFAEAAKYGDCPDNIYMVLRKKDINGVANDDKANIENHNKAVEVFDNIVKDNKLNEVLPEE
ncbi:MAG: hypothetical protein NC203_04575 [Firmicutes bacterium]|nr:hypothetical protein [[Eubacterium] siraeum]MCM1487626.1 hypothetical protein [Bacillota bacterium]